jgi:hypothetical protein
MAAQGRTRSLVGTSGASNDNGNSLAHPNDQICVLTVGSQFVAGGVQIESSLLLLSRGWPGFLRCGFGWAWLAGLGSGS